MVELKNSIGLIHEMEPQIKQTNKQGQIYARTLRHGQVEGKGREGEGQIEANERFGSIIAHNGLTRVVSEVCN